MVNRSGLARGSSGVRLGRLGVLLATMSLGGACTDTAPIILPTPGVMLPRPTATVLPRRSIDKIDILLTLDNSRSMADKQRILAAAIPDLLGPIINPPCVDGSGAPLPTQPSGAQEACPAGSRRRMVAVSDVHLGVVTSSLGGHGSDACPPKETTSCVGGATNTSSDDAGHLVTRKGACSAEIVPTYKDRGFLAWDPAQKLSPPGEKDLGAIHVNPATGAVDTVAPGLEPTLKDLVVGAGEIGCGFESQLESWYRFLAQPDPPESLSIVNGKVVPVGTDTVITTERVHFLRAGSLLLIVLLTDEDDCSLIDGAASYLVLEAHDPADPTKVLHRARARHECATNPDDVCCKPCAALEPDCPPDPACEASPTLTDAEDALNLRCWDQKRRFGFDFLHPLDRYRSALRDLALPDRVGTMQLNPIFTLNQPDGDDALRDPSLVLLAGIVGVPWQDLARDPQDLSRGLKSQREYSITDSQGHTTWDTILGDAEFHTPPSDPHMVTSVAPRDGLAKPGSAPDADPVHGHEYSIPGSDDLQYACVFDLPAPRDCAAAPPGSCDCEDPTGDSPICDPSTPTLQTRAKAYPAIRELRLLESLGSQGVVGSVCPAQLTDPSQIDYGYRPSMDLITSRVAEAAGSEACLSQQLVPDERGLVSCTLIDARTTFEGCVCDPAKGRGPVKNPTLLDSQRGTAKDPFEGANCFCEVVQAGDPESSTPEAIAACEGDAREAPEIASGPAAGSQPIGWCYVDPSKNPAGNPDLVLACPPQQARLIRVVGAAKLGSSSKLVLLCGA